MRVSKFITPEACATVIKWLFNTFMTVLLFMLGSLMSILMHMQKIYLHTCVILLCVRVLWKVNLYFIMELGSGLIRVNGKPIRISC